MALRALHLTVAVAGIAAASAAAYWWQHERQAGPQASASAAPAQGAAAAAAAAVPVEAGLVTAVRMADEAQAVGTLRSRQTVTVRPEVSGRVTQLNFRDGARVRKGQVLVQFDNQLELAQLRQAEAELAIARTNHQRNQELAARNFISASAVDQSAAALQVAQARHALAQVTVARLRILAPFDGITGIGNVNVGDYLSAGQEVVSLDDMGAMFVDYRLPERYQARLAAGQGVRVSFDALPGQGFDARVLAIAPRIDAEGRSVSVRACIDNQRLALRPGMFARIHAVFEVRDNVVAVPEEAVVLASGASYVFRILGAPGAGQGVVAERVEVRLGQRRQGLVEIAEGALRPGERVVLAGQQRLGAGRTPVSVSGAPGGALDGPAAAALAVPPQRQPPPQAAVAPQAVMVAAPGAGRAKPLPSACAALAGSAVPPAASWGAPAGAPAATGV